MQKIIIASGPVIVEDGKVLLNQHGDTPFWKIAAAKRYPSIDTKPHPCYHILIVE